MATIQQINSAILTGDAYFAYLLNINTNNAKSGFPVSNKPKLSCLKSLINALQWDLDINVNDGITTAIYAHLVAEIAPYSGAGVVVDPNVIIPGTTIVVTSGSTYNQSGPIFFDGTIIQILNWNSLYYPLYGNYPEIAIYTGSVATGYQQDTATVPTLNYTNNDPNQPLLSIEWDYGIETTGFILVSGLKPQSI